MGIPLFLLQSDIYKTYALTEDFVPEIPVSVENIVMKCTQKSPDRRYQNMGDMIKDLKQSLINPDAVIAQIDTADDTGKTKVMPGQTPPIPMPAVLDTVWEDKIPRRETYADEKELEAIPNQIKPTRKKAVDNYQDNIRTI